MPRILLFVSFFLLLVNARGEAADWKIGAATVNINPTEPIWLAGYGNRDHPSEGIFQDIWIKAAAFQDTTGTVSVITTADLVIAETVEELVRETRSQASAGKP
jgi:neutral ceramidase